MKGEKYVEDKDHHHLLHQQSHHSTMFAKYPHQQNHQQSLHLSAGPHHHYQLTQTSEEADSPSHLTTTTPTNKKLFEHSGGNDGASIEVVRRPRGRPPGSKNKPKPPVIITRESEPSMCPYVLELPAGVDLIESITSFCRKRNTGLCVLTGSGTVANVVLRQPSTTPGATVTFHGRFDILSITATVLPAMTASNATVPFANGFTISLAGPQGQIVGGAVVGPLLAADTVYIIGASFNNPLYHRLPAEDDVVRHSTSDGAGGGDEGTRGQSPGAVSGGGESGGGGGRHGAGGESCGMSIYSCNLPSTDVIWAPTARQAAAPPPPPPY